jgi:hypothetical protein
MDKIKLGNTNEMLPEIGIGTWKMPNNSIAAETAIKYAIDNGAYFVDTAEMYGNEEMVGRAIKGKPVFIATKVSPHNFRYEAIINSCNLSLRKLNVNKIDLYQLHWPNHSIPISETMKAMEQLQNDGKIQHIGVSNFDIEEFEEAQNCLKNSKIVSNQIEYSVLVRDIGDNFIEFAKKNDITILAYSPLSRGALFSEKYADLLSTLSNIGDKYEKTPAQVALNWLFRNGNVVAIPKAIDESHINENIGASGWHLSEKDASEISSALSGERRRPISSIFTKTLKRNGAWSKFGSKFLK